MSQVTILALGENLIVPIQVELDDSLALRLRDDILKKIEVYGYRGLVIDISAATLIDSFMGRLLLETARMAKLMGCETVLVGMRKEVVVSIIHLGLHLSSLSTALNLEGGLSLLESLKKRSQQTPGASHGHLRGRQ